MITIVDWFFYDTSFYVIPKILWRLTYIWSLYDVWRKNILGTYLQSHLLWRWNLRNRWSGWPQTSDFSAWPPREVEPAPKNFILDNFKPIWGLYQANKTDRFVTYLFYDISFYDIPIFFPRLSQFGPLYDVWRQNNFGTYLLSRDDVWRHGVKVSKCAKNCWQLSQFWSFYDVWRPVGLGDLLTDGY